MTAPKALARGGLRSWLLDFGPSLVVMIAAVVVWEIVCDVLRVPEWLLPAPSRIWAETLVLAPVLPGHIYATLAAIVGGFFIAIIVAVPLAIAIVYTPFLRRVIYPPLLMFQSVPKVAIAPLILMWLGFGLGTNMFIAATVAFFPIVVNTASGLGAVEAELLDLTRSFDAPKRRVFWKLRLPWAMPYFFSAQKVAITFAVIGAVVAEFIGADKGLGYLILASSGAMNTAAMFSVLVILSIIGILCFYAVVLGERLLCPWYLPAEESSESR
jgi:NitT/TauT family transport system permease protein